MVSLLADVLLDKFLGRWLKLEGRKADLSGGVLKLRNVELRSEAFHDLALPFDVRGLIGEVELEVPWTKLKRESCVLKVTQPVILLTPHSETEWDGALEAQRAAARKAAALQALHDAAAASASERKGAAEENPDRQQSWVDRMVERIIDNVQLLITGLVVRYEDYTHSSRPFGLEIACDSLWIHPAHVAAPASGAPVSTKKGEPERPPFQHREALVCALCVYVLQGPQLLPKAQGPECSGDILTRRMESGGLPLDAPAALRANAHRCCVQPLSLAVELCTKRVLAPELPQHVACLETGRVQVDLEFVELEHIAAMLRYFGRFDVLEQHHRYRPPLTQRPVGHARAWWQFAGGAVQSHIHFAREPYTWASIERRCKLRRSFVHLHKKSLRKGFKQLSEGERTSLRQMSDSLSAEDQVQSWKRVVTDLIAYAA